MEILLPVIVLGSLGLLFGIWLAIGQKMLAVEHDERTEHIFSLLPGSNCGACGKAGCYGLAEALSKGNVESINCPVVNENERGEIADILGISAGEEIKNIATLICGGGNRCKDKFQYHGVEGCSAATLLMDGPKACTYGCIGFGSCVESCPFGAIVMGEDNLPRIIPEKCTACGKCIKACPKNILVLSPLTSQYHIYCNSKDKAPFVMRSCKVGCIACGKCVRQCPVGAISLEEIVAVIDYQKCTNCGECIKVCPTKSIIRRKGNESEYSRVE
ncbi:MAG: RnfABCDGE type electron transport complex subunit B [Candidatus Omnitrophica bacterium]|nr:RnfABCDGE type electron transport complex subunit B [Candidatus Omnitrophota bacterium]